MKLVGDGTDACCDGTSTVVVGVKFDAQSRELLTWALVKVAQPGDHIIALHVLDDFVAESTGTILSLVKTFDSMLSVYEGFCNLKQVDLKLKVCRGGPVRKILVREAKACGAAKVVLGTSRTHHTIRSSASVAKYCTRKLCKDFGVYAVNNGKIVYQREGTNTRMDALQDDNGHKNLVSLLYRSLSKNVEELNDGIAIVVAEKSNQENGHCSQRTCSESGRGNCMSCDLRMVISDNSGTKLSDRSSGNGTEDNSLALVQVQSSGSLSSSNAIIVRESPRVRSGWLLIRRLFSTKLQQLEKSYDKKTPVVKWIFRLPSSHSSAVVYPDQKNNHSDQDEDHCFNLDGETGAIVAVGSEMSCPLSSYNGFPKEFEGLHEKYSSMCRLFSYNELVSATSNFMPEKMIGRGGSSHVYRGCLPDGRELAVKILKPSENVLKEFLSEIEIITTLHHKNIISLLGFCFENNCLLLVYDFLSRGSLEENLHGNKKDGNAFGLRERYKVAVGVAEALDYLHNVCAEPVIHRDVKSSNILLSDDFDPQLSDFGLASLVSTSLSHVTCTDVAGTFGYLAPEYFMHGKVSDKIDVYAYGVVLLELLSGRKPINTECPKGQESLVLWAKPILEKGKLSQLLDPSLGCNYDDDQIERMVLAATLCIRRTPRSRPQISLVLKLVQGDDEVMKWAKEQVNASEEPDSVDGELYPTNIQSHLNVALLDLEDDSLSVSSPSKSVSIEDYMEGRWSRTSSFD